MHMTRDNSAIQRLDLRPMDRLMYFVPALFFAYLAGLCVALSLTSIFW